MRKGLPHLALATSDDVASVIAIHDPVHAGLIDTRGHNDNGSISSRPEIGSGKEGWV